MYAVVVHSGLIAPNECPLRAIFIHEILARDWRKKNWPGDQSVIVHLPTACDVANAIAQYIPIGAENV